MMFSQSCKEQKKNTCISILAHKIQDLLVIVMLHAHHNVLLLLLRKLLLLMELLLVSLVLLAHDSQGLFLSDALSVSQHCVGSSVPSLLLAGSICHLHGGLLRSAASRPVANGRPHGKGVGEVLGRLQVNGIPAPRVHQGPDVVDRVHGGAGVVLVLRADAGGKVARHGLLVNESSLTPAAAAAGGYLGMTACAAVGS